MKTRAEILSRLPVARRDAIEKRTSELVLKEHVLRQLRMERGLSQKAIADATGMRQDSISRLERRGDCLVSTIRGYVEALGGHLRLVAEFPDCTSVEIVAEDVSAFIVEDHQKVPKPRGTTDGADRPRHR